MPRSFFGKEIKQKSPSERFNYFPETKDKAAKKRSERAARKAVSGPNMTLAQEPQGFSKREQPAAEPQDESLSPAEQVLAEYGDPDVDAPIKAQDNAPKPFKAMMAAMQAGDDDLAFKYARQWVRHVNNVKKNSSDIMNLTQIAMESEGMLPPGATENLPNYSLLEKELAEQERLASAGDPRAAALLARARQGEPDNASAAADWDERQKAARDFVQRGIAPQPGAPIDIYFFVDPSDRRSLPMIEEVDRLYSRLAGGNDAQIAGFTVRPMEGPAIEEFRRANGVEIPIVDGTPLLSELGVTSAPTVLMVSRNRGEVVITERGFRSFAYLHETLERLQGRR